MPPKKKAKSSILTPKIDIIGKEGGLFKFTLSNTNLSIANAIRRVINIMEEKDDDMSE